MIGGGFSITMKMEEEKYKYIITSFQKKCRGKLKIMKKTRKLIFSDVSDSQMSQQNHFSSYCLILLEIRTLCSKLAYPISSKPSI